MVKKHNDHIRTGGDSVLEPVLGPWTQLIFVIGAYKRTAGDIMHEIRTVDQYYVVKEHQHLVQMPHVPYIVYFPNP